MEARTVKLADGRDVKVPPIPLGLVKKYQAELNNLLTMTPLTAFDRLTKAIPLFTEALKPALGEDLTEEQTAGLVNLGNTGDLTRAMLGEMAVEKKEVTVGEATPVAS